MIQKQVRNQVLLKVHRKAKQMYIFDIFEIFDIFDIFDTVRICRVYTSFVTHYDNIIKSGQFYITKLMDRRVLNSHNTPQQS